ncbi:hypothetical protein ACS0TY_001170 [Phlomoides rotata]
MGSLSIERLHAKKEEVMMELIKGKEIATQLQTLLLKPVGDRSAEDLALQIFRSFDISLSHLTSGAELAQIPAVDCGGSACSGESKRKRRVKDRRGCYKRRMNSDSRVTISPTIEDGWAWRKYGQKKILNSDHPRCYYRCSHKHEGCKAIKQVQRTKGEAIISYEITYFYQHTCTETVRAPHLVVESDPVQRNLISFQTSNTQSKQDQDSPDPIKLSSFKQEDTQSEDASHEAKSSLEDTWQDYIGLDLLGYMPEWVPYQQEVASRFDHYLHGLDMEVDQLSDINTFHFDEINY